MALRTCDRCGYKVAPGTPRTRVGEQMLCAGCVEKSQRKESAMTVRKVAHDSGDGQTIYHCFSCGSGKVIARSDRATECMYCGTVFTVQVQPQFAAFPQTINGMPTPVPGMPGQIDDGGGMPPDPNAPMDPDALGEDGGFPPDEASEEAEENDGDETSSDNEGSDSQPPWLKKSLRTARGHVLDPDDFVRHLAIRYAVDAHLMAGLVKAERQR